MFTILRVLRRSERAQAIVETAIILPLVALLLAAMVDGGRVFHAWITVTNASREGARAASARQAEATIVSRIDSSLGIFTCGVGTTTCTISPIDPENEIHAVGDPVTVTVTTSVDLLTPVIGRLFPSDPVNVSSETVMALE